MAEDGRGVYNPLPIKQGKGELESLGILLPPLQEHITATANLVPKNLRRILLIIGVILLIVIMLIATAVIASLLIYHSASTEDDMEIREKSVKQTNGDVSFEAELRRMYSKIMDMHEPDDLKEIFDNYRDSTVDMETVDDLRAFLASEEMNLHKLDLTRDDVYTTVRLTAEFNSWYTYLSDLKTNLTKYENRMGELKLRHNFKADLRKSRELEKLLKEWTEPMTILRKGDILVFKGKVILLSEVSQYLEESRTLTRDVRVFASHTLYLDSDLVVPGANVALISPKWSFTKPVAVFASGSNAVQHEQRTAPFGLDGLPGNPGGDGGHFLGCGDADLRYLRVYNDGGKGGDGQNGADGRDGIVLKHVSKSLNCKIHLKDVADEQGGTLSYFQVFDSSACGGKGTDGGAPGKGGDGGRIIFMDISNGVKYGSGQRGADGKAGKGGAAGRGAARACYFYGEEKKGKLFAVSATLCYSPAPSGAKGRDGYRSAGRQQEEPKFFANVLREYRSYAREEYSNGFQEIIHFLTKLDDMDNVNVTMAEDLRSELSSIAGTGEVWFYTSLNRRIDRALKYSKEKDLLSYLRVLSYGKMMDLKRSLDKFIIVDLDAFLEKMYSDLESADFAYTDHSVPILANLVERNVDYLMDSLDRWMAKCTKLSKDHNLDLNRMAQLTYLTAQGLEAVLGTVTGGKTNISDLVKQYTPPRGPKTSTPRFLRLESRLLRELNSDVRDRLKPIKRLLKSLNYLYDPESELSDFQFVVDYLENTLHLQKTIEEKNKFREYIDDAVSLNNADSRLGAMKKELLDLLITSQYRDAVNMFRQWVFPHMSAYEQSLPENATVDGARNGISLLRRWIKEYKSTITPYDKYIREATFSSNSSVGEYYKWFNREIHSELIDLFRGRKILLTADVENKHIYTKNAIKFKSVRIEFHSKYDNLKTLLRNVQVEMKHSGYSYYYYNGQTYMQLGEAFDLRYSYEVGSDNKPNNCNMVYKKLLNGPAILSPYTSWTIQLRGITGSLMNFVDDVDIALVGSGSYVEVANPETGF